MGDWSRVGAFVQSVFEVEFDEPKNCVIPEEAREDWLLESLFFDVF